MEQFSLRRRSQSAKATAVVETITPERAKELLATIPPVKSEEKKARPGRNRNISPNWVAELAAAMGAHRWQINGESLKISHDGQMLDGQHRCLACIKAKVPFETWVVYGVDPDAFDTIDTGRGRSAGDVLTIDGCRNGTKVAAAMRWIRALESAGENYYRPKLMPDVARLFWYEHPQIEESVSLTVPAWKIIAPGIIGALHFKLRQIDAVAAEKFVDDLGHGAGLEKGDSLLLLREQLIRNKASRLKMPSDEIMARCVRAWNHRREGHKTQVLRGMIMRDDGSKSLPQLVG